jgi:hypothetical protein
MEPSSMPTEFVVTSPAASGVGALKAHYPTVEAALQVANMLLDEGTSRVRILDGEGNTVLREDQIKLRNRLICQNIETLDYLRAQLSNFESGVYDFGANKSGAQDNDINMKWIYQLRLWIAERDTLLADLDCLLVGFLEEPFPGKPTRRGPRRPQSDPSNF